MHNSFWVRLAVMFCIMGAFATGWMAYFFGQELYAILPFTGCVVSVVLFMWAANELLDN